MWLFHLEGFVPEVSSGPAFTPLTSGNYAFVNSIGRGPLSVTDGMLTSESDAAFGAIGWTVTAGQYDQTTNTQALTLKNMATGLYIAGVSEQAVSTITFGDGWGVFANNGGYNVTLTSNAAEAATLTLSRESAGSDNYFLSLDGKLLFALGATSELRANGVNARENAPAMQGSTWALKRVSKAVKATATEGNETVGTFYHYDLEGETPASNPLAIPYELYAYVSQTDGAVADGHQQTTVTVKRIKRVVTYRLTDSTGLIWETVTDTIGASEPFVPVAPERPYLTFKNMGAVEGDVATVVYTTEALPGIRKVGSPLSAVEPGVVYAIEDTHSERHAFRGQVGNKVGGRRDAEGSSPSFLWTLEAAGSDYYIKNVCSGLYVQSMPQKSVSVLLGETPNAYGLTYSGSSWTVTDKASGNCWDGVENLDLVGWTNPGHPIAFYPLVEAEPFYTISISERLDGVEFASRLICVKAGSSYAFAANSRPGKSLVGIEGNENLDKIYAHKQIVVNYVTDNDAISEIAADPTDSPKGIYDLSGRRLNKIVRPGVYVINGVKTLVR